MRFVLPALSTFLLLADIVTASAIAAVERENEKRTYKPVKILTISKIVEILKCSKADKFCSSWLHYSSKTKTTTKTKTVTKTTTKKKTVTVTDCITTEPYVYDTTTLFIGPVTTITELDVTSTAVSLVFAGPIISAEDKKVKRWNDRYPDPRLTGQPSASISKGCSSYVRTPGTKIKTVTKTKTATTTRTSSVTIKECAITDYSLILATTTAPSSTVEGPGFHTVTVATTTETIQYFCWPAGFGCATEVPIPCCDPVTPLACQTVPGMGGHWCGPTDPDLFSSYWSLTATTTATAP
ncbi:hypothetical protein H072_3409 [Dactylellina haptotyla CBS 200.50]|uniref:CBM1 domain-containing protein n=1 Tax=Dactylellina haptotyla (strain CBS 200.50) TaxID=1284197 RepID=S8AHT3_DACHA|nr:hypothetical protein H072_3409 [Dactylellina haptotyla CBS 200.50]